MGVYLSKSELHKIQDKETSHYDLLKLKNDKSKWIYGRVLKFNHKLQNFSESTFFHDF